MWHLAGSNFWLARAFSGDIALGICSWLAVALLVPSLARKPQTLRLCQQMRLLAQPRAMLPLLITIMSCGGISALLTYITPLLEQVAGFAPTAISTLLLLFGVGSMGGNFLGGWLADWCLFPSLFGLQVLQVVVLFLFSFWGRSPTSAVIALPRCSA